MKFKEIYDKAIMVGKAMKPGHYDHERVCIDEDGDISVEFINYHNYGDTDTEEVFISEEQFETLTVNEIITIKKKEEYDIQFARELQKKEAEKAMNRRQEKEDLALYIKLRKKFEDKNPVQEKL